MLAKVALENIRDILNCLVDFGRLLIFLVVCPRSLIRPFLDMNLRVAWIKHEGLGRYHDRLVLYGGRLLYLVRIDLAKLDVLLAAQYFSEFMGARPFILFTLLCDIFEVILCSRVFFHWFFFLILFLFLINAVNSFYQFFYVLLRNIWGQVRKDLLWVKSYDNIIYLLSKSLFHLWQHIVDKFFHDISGHLVIFASNTEVKLFEFLPEPDDFFSIRILVS